MTSTDQHDPDRKQPPLLMLGHSGLFDTEFYLANNRDLAHLGSEALLHYHLFGWREGRKPNAHFDPRWYCETHAEWLGAETDPLLHYIEHGEAAGLRPISWFDPHWYRANHDVPAGMLALAHYLFNKARGGVRPMPGFDPDFYLHAYPDIALAGLDPVEHYMTQGFREARRPFAGFDPVDYRRTHLAEADLDANPLLHYLARRDAPPAPAPPTASRTTIADEVRRTSVPGPHFETRRPLPQGVVPRALLLAYYLPQFHPCAENDAWWGEGFTEWTNLQRGLPRFAGHYQPRIPRDLGHYRLDDPAVMRRQIEMARAAGIGGFAFYFYWFDRKRLLDGPLEAFLADRSLAMPFCLMWANENWSRRWDGSEDEVLLAQHYREEDEAALVAAFVRHFDDPRYIRLHGRPLLLIYRVDVIPDARATIARWRQAFRRAGAEPLLVMAQAFDCNDPREYGLDGAIEFPPHKVARNLELINQSLDILDPALTANVHAYDAVVERALAEPPAAFPLIRTAAPSWDNDARRQGHGLVLHGSTPSRYEDWLAGLIDRAVTQPFFGTPVVAINAWNEWAEGAYLEPDQHFGSAYLNATARALLRGRAGDSPRDAAHALLLVGHDAYPSGAQRLLLALGARLRGDHGVMVRFLLLGDGALRAAYEAVAPTTIAAADSPAVADLLDGLRARGLAHAVLNTSATALLAPALSARGIAHVQLVHELPGLLGAWGLLDPLRRSAACASAVIYPNPFVRQRVDAALGAAAEVLPGAPRRLLAQGLYTATRFSTTARRALRARLAIPPDAPVLIGCGHGDLRKGLDLFLQLVQLDLDRRVAGRAPVHAIWLGPIDPGLRQHLGAEIEAAVEAGQLHLPGQTEAVGEWLSAADVFALTSREDPLPTAALEAMACGLPCIAFRGTGGVAELIDAEPALGTCVPVGQTAAMLRAARAAARRTQALPARQRAARGRAFAARFSFTDYADALLGLALPATRRISAAVLSFDYARYLDQRLASVFGQTHPLDEVLVLDDASTDDSVAVAEAAASAAGRRITLHRNARNSGSVFRQWHEAARRARGEWLWIAEADDAAEPEMLARLAAALDRAPAAVMAFCDSVAIDADGAVSGDGYKPYYAETVGTLLDHDGVFDGPEFVRTALAERNLVLNASAVLFRREALLAALDSCAGALATLRMAGDWRVYIELLNRPGAQLAYVAQPLNRHRRHALSVTHRLAAGAHLDEIAAIHEAVSPGAGARQEAYRRKLHQQFNGG